MRYFCLVNKRPMLLKVTAASEVLQVGTIYYLYTVVVKYLWHIIVKVIKLLKLITSE